MPLGVLDDIGSKVGQILEKGDIFLAKSGAFIGNEAQNSQNLFILVNGERDLTANLGEVPGARLIATILPRISWKSLLE
jgi:hypothetical protein